METKSRKWSWADLPLELAEHIMSYLSFSDQIRFRATCRAWNSLAKVVPRDQLPWLFAHNHKGSYTLKDPSINRTYTLNVEPEDPANIIFEPIMICAAKFGWLLFFFDIKNILFFFNPIKNEVIHLPPLEIRQLNNASFSSAPTEPDCIVIALLNTVTRAKVMLCHLKDKKWTTYEADGVLNEKVWSVVYLERKFYCAQGNGRVGIFNVDEEKLTYLPESEAIKCRNSSQSLYMIEGDGEIHLAIASFYFHFTRYFRLDVANNEWVRVGKLENRAWFLTSYASLAVYTTIREMRDRFHYRGDMLKYHSINARRSYTCTKYYGKVVEDKKAVKIWFQPPF